MVASEVKNLATQTGKATEDISQQINSIQNETGQAVQAIENIAGTIEEINQITAGVAAAVEEQSSATKEIARSVEQAASGTRDMSSSIQTVTDAASQTGNAAGQMLGSSNALSSEAHALRQEVEQFLVDDPRDVTTISPSWPRPRAMAESLSDSSPRPCNNARRNRRNRPFPFGRAGASAWPATQPRARPCGRACPASPACAGGDHAAAFDMNTHP